MAQTAEELVQAHFDRLHAYVRMRVPASDCEDVVGDILLRAIERLDQLAGDPAAWLFTIARTRIADHYRHKGAGMNARIATAEPESLAARPSPSSLDPLAALEHAEFRELLQAKLTLLSELERDVIAFKFTDGLSNIQIASILNLTPVNLGVILHRALRRLRNEMLQAT